MNVQALSAEKVYGNAGNPDVLALLGQEDRRILDIGCGNGVNASLLSARGCLVDGISISEQELAIARPHLQRSFLHNLENGLPNLEKEYYDAVICSHVLEHIAYPDKLLDDVNRVLKKGGHLIVALPNLLHYKSRLELLKGNFRYEEAGLWDYTHVRWYTFESARLMLEKKGFTVEVATVTGELPLNSLWKRVLPASVRSGIFNGLMKMSKGFFGYQLLYKVRSYNSGK